MCTFKTRLEARGYPKSLIEKTLSEVSFAARQSTLKKQTKKTRNIEYKQYYFVRFANFAFYVGRKIAGLTVTLGREIEK